MNEPVEAKWLINGGAKMKIMISWLLVCLCMYGTLDATFVMWWQ